MSQVSGKCDFLDHLCMMKHRTKEGSDKKEDLEKARVLYSDLFECFEIFKERTDGIVHQHKRIKEVTPYNHDFIAEHSDAFKVHKNVKHIKDARTKSGYREEVYYDYEYFGKTYTAKELSKKGVYITVEIHLDTLIEAIPYFPYIVTMCCYNNGHEIIYLSDKSYVESEYDNLLQGGYETLRNHYHKQLAELTREIVLNYFNPEGKEVIEEINFVDNHNCEYFNNFIDNYLGFTQHKVDTNFPIEWFFDNENKCYWTSPKVLGHLGEDQSVIEMSKDDYEYYIGHTCKVKYVKYEPRKLYLD